VGALGDSLVHQICSCTVQSVLLPYETRIIIEVLQTIIRSQHRNIIWQHQRSEVVLSSQITWWKTWMWILRRSSYKI
jgi:hypothetical protein